MAINKREQNCSVCEHCVTGAAKRFRCTALPANPGQWWDGFPEQHWCSVYYSPKKQESAKPGVTEKVVADETILDKPVKIK